jgi:hypothetical protein
MVTQCLPGVCHLMPLHSALSAAPGAARCLAICRHQAPDMPAVRGPGDPTGGDVRDQPTAQQQGGLLLAADGGRGVPHCTQGAGATSACTVLGCCGRCTLRCCTTASADGHGSTGLCAAHWGHAPCLQHLGRCQTLLHTLAMTCAQEHALRAVLALTSIIPNLPQAQSSSVASSLCPSCDRQGPAGKQLLLLGQPQVLALEVQGGQQVGSAACDAA